MRGRKPTPISLKNFRRSPLKKALQDDSPRPEPAPLDAPDYLDKQAAEKWREIAPKLRRLGLLTEVDLGSPLEIIPADMLDFGSNQLEKTNEKETI